MSGSPPMGIAACTCLSVLYVASVHHFLKSSQQGGPSCEHRAFHLPTLYPNTNVSINKPFSKKSQISRPTGKQRQSATAQYRTKKTRNFQCDSGATRSAPSGKAPASSGQRHCTPAPPLPVLTCLRLSPVLIAVNFGGRLSYLSSLRLLMWEDLSFSCMVWLDKLLLERGTENRYSCYLSVPCCGALLPMLCQTEV